MNATRLGALRPSEPREETGAPDSSGLRWSYLEDGGLRAVGVASIAGEEGTIQATAELDHPRALAAVTRRLLLELRRRGVREAVGRLPFDARIEALYDAAGVGYVLREVATQPAGNMLLLADLPGLVAAAEPEWRARLADAGIASGPVLRLRSPDAGEAQVALTDRTDGEVQVLLRPREMLLLLLGYRAWSELRDRVAEPVATRHEPFLTALFTRQPTATGPLG